MPFCSWRSLFPRAATKEQIQQTRISIGQSVLVQVVKEEQGSKGPKVTANISLPGRYAVLMPTVDYIGVSKEKSGMNRNDRLRAIASRLKPEGMGIIIRTVANGIAEAELIADITHLPIRKSVLRRYELARKPKLLYREADLVMRTIRDYCTDDVKKSSSMIKKRMSGFAAFRRMTAGDNGSACIRG